jgi:hypothetical protein
VFPLQSGLPPAPPPAHAASHYEHLYGEALPAEGGGGRSKQEQLQEQIQRLIAKKPPAAAAGGTRAPEAKAAVRGARPGRGPPSRLVNPVSTMPGVKASQAWIGNGRVVAADATGPVRLAPDENEQPGRQRPAVPPLQLPGSGAAAAAQQQEEAAAAGRLWRPQEAGRTSSLRETPRVGMSSMPGSPSRSLTSRGASGISHLGAAAPVLLRQIELKAALRPPSADPPHKSPWRPPGALRLRQPRLSLDRSFAGWHPRLFPRGSCLPTGTRSYPPLNCLLTGTPSSPLPPGNRQERQGDALQAAAHPVDVRAAAVPPRLRLTGHLPRALRRHSVRGGLGAGLAWGPGGGRRQSRACLTAGPLSRSRRPWTNVCWAGCALLFAPNVADVCLRIPHPFSLSGHLPPAGLLLQLPLGARRLGGGHAHPARRRRRRRPARSAGRSGG